MANAIYSYNGIELPELPDTGSYSYHYIIRYSGVVGYTDGYMFMATNAAAFYSSDGVAFPGTTTALVWICIDGENWSGGRQYDLSALKGPNDYLYITSLGSVVWTRPDICYEASSTVYMEGSEPVLLVSKWANMRGLVRGILVGLMSKGVIRGGDASILVAYLFGAPAPTVVTYNGVELPELPEWNKSVYPYAVVNGTALFCFQIEPEYGTHDLPSGGTKTCAYVFVPSGQISQYIYFSVVDGAWKLNGTNTIDATGYTVGRYSNLTSLVWTNTDVPNVDTGGTYLAATEPVYTNSGNIALATADGYTLYNGAVLPPLPRWDKSVYPYADIFPGSSDGEYYLECHPEARVKYGTFTLGGNTYTVAHFEVNAGEKYERLRCKCTVGGQWEELSVQTIDRTGNSTGYTMGYTKGLLWTNTDIPNVDDGTTYLAAAAPVALASTEPVAAVYGGVKLPELPEWDKTAYPYAYITKNSSGVTRLLCSYIPLEYGTYNSSGTSYTKIYIDIPKGKITTTWNFDLSENAWSEGYQRSWDRTAESLNLKSTFASVLWSNTDIPNLDTGGTYLAASDPIPVYE